MFRCSYCGTTFLDKHSDYECRDVLMDSVYNTMISLDKDRIKMLVNYINKLHR